ncbi:MAG: small multi-drug export protein, partial [Clostridia bacterium]|nr:small multi-drug export protein [Clostridia bacterium]
KTTKLFHPLAVWIEGKADHKKDQVLKYSTWGLFLFVAIPIPGTGAWTGALIAALLEMKVKSAFVTILLGMICAALIMTLGSMIVDGLISGQWPEDLQLLGDLLTGIRDYLSSLLSDHSVTVS